LSSNSLRQPPQLLGNSHSPCTNTTGDSPELLARCTSARSQSVTTLALVWFFDVVIGLPFR
jgi:hypothetical protein